jgi:hypothetical protein
MTAVRNMSSNDLGTYRSLVFRACARLAMSCASIRGRPNKIELGVLRGSAQSNVTLKFIDSVSNGAMCADNLSICTGQACVLEYHANCR